MTLKKESRKYVMKDKKDRDICLQTITMIYQALVWIEVCSVSVDRADLVANQVELVWLTRYPLPYKIIVNRGKELLVEFKTMMANDYRIHYTFTSVRNPQANVILEGVHQALGNIICTFKI